MDSNHYEQIQSLLSCQLDDRVLVLSISQKTKKELIF
jgi:hypothetical protein